jgi:membrane protease YdiL (CAAX protease family)
MKKCLFVTVAIALWLGAGALFVRADISNPGDGHVGCALVRDGATGFFRADYVPIKSPADDAGIKKGDLIVSIDDVPTRDMSLIDALHFFNGNIGGIVSLTVRRDGIPDRKIAVVRRSLSDTYLSAAEAGDATAQYDVGYLYQYGPRGERDLGQAAEWYRKAADQGDVRAEVELSYMLRNGIGTFKNLPAAGAWSLKAAKTGDSIAERELGNVYLHGYGLPQSDHQAFDWLYSAARQDDPIAEHSLAYLYLKGQGVGRDDIAAFDWYYRSAQLGNYSGEWGLAYMYQTGRGVKKNTAEALRWYKLAQAGFPKDDKLKRTIFALSLREFMENPNSGALDLSTLSKTFRWQLSVVLALLAGIYIDGVVILLVFSFLAEEGPVHLALAIGWILLYVESQVVALVALFFFGKSLSADSLMMATVLLGALPVIISTLGSNRVRMWQQSPVSGGTIFLHVLAAYFVLIVVNGSYDALFKEIASAPMPVQPTHALISKTKGGSATLAYIMIAVVIPVAEEILFRGYLFGAVRRASSDAVAVVVTAFCFSLFHLQLFYFVPLFVMGLVLGWLRLQTRSLRVPILMHAFNNWVVLVHMS